ncbi:MAG: hypothetical protein WA793_08900 [Sphingorhabdus sp.]
MNAMSATMRHRLPRILLLLLLMAASVGGQRLGDPLVSDAKLT